MIRHPHVWHAGTPRANWIDDDARLWVVTQSPYPEDQANLPNRLYVLSTYTQLNPGSCNVAVVIQNRTFKAIDMASSQQIRQVITANTVPDP